MHPFNKKMFDAAASILDVDELKKAIVSIRTDARCVWVLCGLARQQCSHVWMMSLRLPPTGEQYPRLLMMCWG